MSAFFKVPYLSPSVNMKLALWGLWMIGLAFSITACRDVRLARQAAQTTIEMNEKMDTMVTKMAAMDENMVLMQETMDDMQEAMGDMSTQMGSMMELMESMQHIMITMGVSMEGMTEVMTQMQTSMDSMTGVMSDMQNKMIDMASGMERMGEIMEDMKLYGKQLGANISRHIAWTALVNSENKIETKLTLATKYYYSYEFHTLAPEDRSDQKMISALLYNAVREYYRQVRPLIQSTGWGLGTNGKGSQMNTLYALAAAMHEYNYNQDLTNNSEPINFEDLLKQGLAVDAAQREARDRDEVYERSFGDFVEETGIWLRDAEYLLQLRHNIISAIIVRKLSRFDRPASYDAPGLVESFYQGSAWIRPWKINYADVSTNSALLKELTKFMAVTNELRDFLRCRDLEVRYDKLLLRVIKNIIVDDHLVEIIKRDQAHDPSTGEEFIATLEAFKSSVSTEVPLRECLSHDDYLESLPQVLQISGDSPGAHDD